MSKSPGEPGNQNATKDYELPVASLAEVIHHTAFREDANDLVPLTEIAIRALRAEPPNLGLAENLRGSPSTCSTHRAANQSHPDRARQRGDGARRRQEQTRKLFEVCRLRGASTITFVNKLDPDGCETSDLLDEIE